ncbi:hypothetical protein JOC76_004772 [Neobacillus cucumis]|nr:hypothetical protein [Neobacillus cucumis]
MDFDIETVNCYPGGLCNIKEKKPFGEVLDWVAEAALFV